MFNQGYDDEELDNYSDPFGDSNVGGDSNGGDSGGGGDLGIPDPGQGGGDDFDPSLWDMPGNTGSGQGSGSGVSDDGQHGNDGQHDNSSGSGAGNSGGVNADPNSPMPSFLSTPKQPMSPMPKAGQADVVAGGGGPGFNRFTSRPSSRPYRPKPVGQPTGGRSMFAPLGKGGMSAGQSNGNGLDMLMSRLKSRKGMF